MAKGSIGGVVDNHDFVLNDGWFYLELQLQSKLILTLLQFFLLRIFPHMYMM